MKNRVMSTLFWLAAAACSPCFGANPSASEIFQKMENKLRQAETISLTAKSIVKDQMDVTTELQLAASNKATLRVKLKQNASETQERRTDLHSDGKTLTSVQGNSTRTEPVDPRLCEHLRDSLTHSGFLTAYLTIASREYYTEDRRLANAPTTQPGQSVDKAKRIYSATKFVLGEETTIGGHRCRAISYRVDSELPALPVSVTLWIDVKTDLPVRRTSTSSVLSVTESYTQWKLTQPMTR